MKERNLIFIISQPRSGSTLLQTILSNSKAIQSHGNESWLLLPFLSFDKPDIHHGTFGSDLAAKAIFQNISREIIVEEIKSCLSRLYNQNLNDQIKYVLDKTPRYYEILDEIVEYFPNAKILLLRRNPLDVFTSIIQKWPRKKYFDLVYFRRDIFQAPLKIEKFWKENQSNPNVNNIYYEDIVTNPKIEIERIFNWLDLPFEEEFLNYNAPINPEFGDDKIMKHSHVHDKSIGSWKGLRKDRRTRLFFEGYINYLQKNDISSYNLQSYKHKDNFRFRSLLDFCEFMSRNEKEFSFQNLIKYIKFYFYSKIL